LPDSACLSIFAPIAITIRTKSGRARNRRTSSARAARPEKAEGGRPFKLVSDYSAAGDQPTAIKELVESALAAERDQVLLGVTGSAQVANL
jgi:excinuclease ABC subunit B